MKNPCRDCPERLFKCHASCKRYIAWKSEQTVINEKRRSVVRNEQMLNDLAFKAIERSKK